MTAEWSSSDVAACGLGWRPTLGTVDLDVTQRDSGTGGRTSEEEASLAAIADWGPTEDWSGWGEDSERRRWRPDGLMDGGTAWRIRLTIAALLGGVTLAAIFLRAVLVESLRIEATHEVGNDGWFDAVAIAACNVVIVAGAIGGVGAVALPLLDRLLCAVRNRREAEWRAEA